MVWSDSETHRAAVFLWLASFWRQIREREKKKSGSLVLKPLALVSLCSSVCEEWKREKPRAPSSFSFFPLILFQRRSVTSDHLPYAAIRRKRKETWSDRLLGKTETAQQKSLSQIRLVVCTSNCSRGDGCNPHGYRILFLASFFLFIHSFIHSSLQIFYSVILVHTYYYALEVDP